MFRHGNQTDGPIWSGPASPKPKRSFRLLWAIHTAVHPVPLRLCAAVKVREQDTAISFRLPGGLAPTAESTCQNLLTGLMVYLAQLHDEYPENIEVMEA